MAIVGLEDYSKTNVVDLSVVSFRWSHVISISWGVFLNLFLSVYVYKFT